LPDIIKEIKSTNTKWGGYLAKLEDIRNPYKILLLKPEGEKPVGKCRCR
jgi:hypothetical protein